MSRETSSFIPEHGQRALIAGQTGFGKTAFALWLLVRIPTTPTFIYDTKVEPKFASLPNSIVVTSIEEMQKAFHDVKLDYIIVRPPEEMLGQPEELDNYLWYHYLHFHHTVCYVDEATTFHTSTGRPYKGLLSLMMRGRSKGITTILSTQRPVGISRAIISEMSKAYIFYMQDKRDRETVDNVIPDFSKLPLPKKHWFYFWETGMTTPVLYQPVELDRVFDTGYTDKSASEASMVQDGNVNQAPDATTPPPSKHVWV